MSTNYQQLQLAINSSTRKLVDSNNDYVELANAAKPRFYYGETVVLCLSTVVDNNGAAYAFNAGDTFEACIDLDLSHTLDTTLQANITAGAITSIAINLTATQCPESAGTVTVTGGGHTESFEYTACSITANVATLTVSATASNSYTAGATIAVNDGTLAAAGNAQIDIASDWASIDRATGKISIRLDCMTSSFLRKVTARETTAYLEVIRYPTGLSSPSIVLQDTVFVSPAVIDFTYSPSPASLYYTSAQVDALLAAYCKLVESGNLDLTGDLILTDSNNVKWHITINTDGSLERTTT